MQGIRRSRLCNRPRYEDEDREGSPDTVGIRNATREKKVTFGGVQRLPRVSREKVREIAGAADSSRIRRDRFHVELEPRTRQNDRCFHWLLRERAPDGTVPAPRGRR